MSFHVVDNKSNSKLLVRLINLSRIPMYFSVAWMQYLWYLDCIRGPAPASCNPWNFGVPMYLGLLDVLMGFWSIRPSRKFWSAALLVSLIAIGISANSLLPIIRGISSNIPMLIMGVLVLSLSLIEFRELLRIRNRIGPAPMVFAKYESEIRTYDSP
ncbi:MAG: hypothetical protein ACFFEU_03950 [Candidatus Thorarchaeota archaeon]